MALDDHMNNNNDIQGDGHKSRNKKNYTEFLFPDSLTSSIDFIEPRDLNRQDYNRTDRKCNTDDKYSLAPNSRDNNEDRIKTRPKKITAGLNQTQIVAISGALAGFLSGIIVCPLDVTKTRLQAQGLQATENPYYKGIFGTMSTIVRDEGATGLYKGIVPIVLGYFPTWMIYFSVYEFSKKSFKGLFPYSEFMSHSFSAITAGAVSTTLTNPIWVVKTRLMSQSNLGSYPTRYRGTLNAFSVIYKQEGIKAFYRGLVPSLLGLFHVAIHFPVYEELKVKLNCYSQNDNSCNNSSINLKNLIMASSLSKMIASIITYPHEILRTRMQLRTNLPTKIHHKLIPLIKNTYYREGFIGFYSGFAANLFRTVPASAITLVSFEYVRNHLSKLNHEPTNS